MIKPLGHNVLESVEKLSNMVLGMKIPISVFFSFALELEKVSVLLSKLGHHSRLAVFRFTCDFLFFKGINSLTVWQVSNGVSYSKNQVSFYFYCAQTASNRQKIPKVLWPWLEAMLLEVISMFLGFFTLISCYPIGILFDWLIKYIFWITLAETTLTKRTTKETVKQSKYYIMFSIFRAL